MPILDEHAQSFGFWLRRQRKALDLTQEALGLQVSCSGFTIRKIEADERRPSRSLAERLAKALAVPDEERRAFLVAARSSRAPGWDGSGMHRAEGRAGDGPESGDGVGSWRVPSEAMNAQAGVTPSWAPQAGTVDAAAVPFVGRDNEFGLLAGLVARLSAGNGHVALIEGEPGIGKTRLVREVLRYAESHGLPTLATSCYEIERAIPYQPIVDLVTRAIDRASPAALDDLSPVSLAELAPLVPIIAERFSDLPALSRDFPEARQARLCRAVGQVLEAARNGRPLVLAVDDLQWVDDASAQVLHYVARHASARPVLVLYAYRDEALDSDARLARLVESLRRDSGARQLSLARLGLNDAEALLTALGDTRLAAPGLGARLHHETDGNPFFLLSMLQSAREGEITLPVEEAPALLPAALRTAVRAPEAPAPALLPDALRTAVRARLAHVPASHVPVLETAAALGGRCDFDTLLQATGMAETDLLDAVEALVKRHLLREETNDGSYVFSHDKLREVVYQDISSARRVRLHRAVAEALEWQGEDDSHEQSARLAEHYERAHDWSRALRFLVLTGERSQTLFAMRDALHWLDRAVALAEAHPEALDSRGRVALYERRGAARAQAGQTEGAVADIRRVIDAARAEGERGKARDALVLLGMAYRRADAYELASACLVEALAEGRALGDERRTADVLYHLGTVAWSTGANDQAIRCHQEAVDICERSPSDDVVAVQSFHGRGEAYFANAEPAPAIRCYTRSLEIARAIGDRSYECENLMMIGHALTGSKGLGDYGRAQSHFEAALEIARAADLQWHMGPILLGVDHVRACTGEYGAAWSGMQQTIAWLDSLEQVRYRLIAYDYIAFLLLDLGLAEAALEEMERARELARSTRIEFWRPNIEAQAAIASTRLGARDSLPGLERVLEQTRRTAERYMSIRCLEAIAEAALAQGDASRALAAAGELLELAETNGLREATAHARHWRGEALTASNRYDDAMHELTEAAALAREVGRVRLRWDVAQARARLHDLRGETGLAQHERAAAKAVGEAIVASAAAAGLEARLRAEDVGG